MSSLILHNVTSKDDTARAIAPKDLAKKAFAASEQSAAKSRQGIETARQEWRDSCVSEAIIAANVRYVEGDEAVDLLTRPAIENMGGHAAQYATGKVINLRKRYEHVLAGGWWVSGLDPLNDWQQMEWGQFKPVKPRDRWDVPDKLIKYETPAKQSTRAIFLDGAVDWQALQTDITTPRLWTEGAKKAGAALTADYAAVALPGVNSGYRSKDALGNPIAPYLIPDVVAMAQPGSVHYLAFDQDDKPETRQKVAIALSRFGKLLTAAGCTIKIVRWSPGKGKGIDDLISNHGADAFHQAIEAALPLDEWQLWQALDNRLTVAPTIRLKAHDLKVLSAESVPDTGIIAIASAKGTGKTNLIGGLIAGKDKALLAGHRISLMRNLSERCGVNYRGDLDKQGGRFIVGDAYTLRLGTCVDSLLAIAPDSFRGCDLVLDEVCQVLRHLLTSSTCHKDGKRPVLLGRFKELLQTARRVIIADADLDNKAIAYIQHLRGDGARPFLIRNDYQTSGYPVRFIEASDASAITGELLRDLQAGKRVYVVTDSKRGSKRIHRLIAELSRSIPSLLVNSETSGGEVERAFMEDPDRHLSAISLQAVTTSPSAGTGLSIEGNHFDKVYGIFYGASSTDADMSQALGRVRENLPRVVWCAKYGRNFSKAGRDGSALKLRELLRQKSEYTASTLLIRSSLSEMGSDGLAGYDWANDPHLKYWSEVEAERNRSMWNLRTALRIRLMHEGHQIERVELGSDEQARNLLKAAREDLKMENAIAVEMATNLTAVEAKQLDQLDGLDETQRLALQKWKIADFYCLNVEQVNADLVRFDNDGRRRGQLLNLEGFLHAEEAAAADVRSLEKQAKWQKNFTQKGYTPWDLSNVTLKRDVRLLLGLDAYLAPGKVWDSQALAEFRERAIAYAPQIKAALNFTIKLEMSATQILNQLLEQMGITCEAKQHRKDGGRVRIYQIDAIAWTLNIEILERRKKRREQVSESGTPLLVTDHSRKGCDTAEPTETSNSDCEPGVGVHLPAAPLDDSPDPLAPDHYDAAAWGWSV
ncbi:MAG: hypothetical protein DCF15_19500 [Phormidesmis priestleyi]|uniref:DUF3854 domain-containing protein n=1 Tax=Phormidesmis priestleyi TaxID=268141 RepID=A0A2W4WRB6_9CYAN|nr:MAG: hypothetical protein DCF15_19500 [Phormidesmis priestleyi]